MSLVTNTYGQANEKMIALAVSENARVAYSEPPVHYLSAKRWDRYFSVSILKSWLSRLWSEF